MHSPGGGGNRSRYAMWGLGNVSAADRQWSGGLDLLTPLVVTGASVLSLTQAGALVRIGGWGLRIASSPLTWGAYNLSKEYADVKHAISGGKFRPDVSLTYRPLRFPGWFGRSLAVAIPFPWLDWQGVHVEGSSSQTYQQNGGPSAPLHRQGQPAPLVVPAASSSAHGGGRSGAKPRTRKRCPPGYRWNGKRCVRKG